MEIDVKKIFEDLEKVQKIKVSDEAILLLEEEIKKIAEKIIKEAKEKAKKENRKEIFESDLYDVKVR